jgi:hypothetical protein
VAIRRLWKHFVLREAGDALVTIREASGLRTFEATSYRSSLIRLQRVVHDRDDFPIVTTRHFAIRSLAYLDMSMLIRLTPPTPVASV